MITKISGFYQGIVAVVGLTLLATTGFAQREMTIDELQEYVDEKKAALEVVQQNHEVTQDEARKVRLALEQKQQRLKKIEDELGNLCLEQEKIEAGTLDQCMAAIK